MSAASGWGSSSVANRVVTGTITALDGVVTVALQGSRSVGVTLLGTWTATIVAEVSSDNGTTYQTVPIAVLSSETFAASVAANGVLGVPYVAGMTHARVRASAYTSGTVTVTLAASQTESQLQRVSPIVNQAGVAAGAGAVGATVQRTTLASDDPAVVALQILDDIVASGRAKVDPIVGQAGVAAGAGAVGATVQRTTLASDDPAVVALQLLDDIVESGRAKSNPIVGQAGVQGGAGASTALTQRVAIATDANTVDTELPAAAAPSDGYANPTAPAVVAVRLNYNGSTWDLVRNGLGTGLLAQRVVNGREATYRTALNFAAAGGGVALEIVGSASKVVRIKRIVLQPSATAIFTTNKYSVASTGGTDSDPAMVPLDPSSAAATANIKAFTVNPTAGTLVGAINVTKIAADGLGEDALGDHADNEPVTLRAAAQTVGIVCDTACTVRGFVEWAET